LNLVDIVLETIIYFNLDIEWTTWYGESWIYV